MFAMVVASWVLPLDCATLERLSLDDMITRSTTIVRGKVTASWAAFTGSVIYTHYQIQVSEQFKGAAAEFRGSHDSGRHGQRTHLRVSPARRY